MCFHGSQFSDYRSAGDSQFHRRLLKCILLVQYKPTTAVFICLQRSNFTWKDVQNTALTLWDYANI